MINVRVGRRYEWTDKEWAKENITTLLYILFAFRVKSARLDYFVSTPSKLELLLDSFIENRVK